MASAGHTRLDPRIRTLIENGVARKHRSFFVIVGNKAKFQVPTLHHMLSKSVVAARPSVLWCYKQNLGFSTHRGKKSRERAQKSRVGNVGVSDSPLDIFVSSTQIRFCYYSETQNILGNTYGMLVLQDFEAITPNLLARTIETVEGGGLVVLLLDSINSLRQLYTVTMDVHHRFRSSLSNVQPRFNERFILSLASCPTCLIVSDVLGVLPITSHSRNIEPVTVSKNLNENEQRLKDLQEQLKDTKPISQLLVKCRTLDQATTFLKLVDFLTDRDSKVVASITASRGRGKSASMGLALAAAMAFGYTNIFVTSPSPENLKTLFEFVVKGLQALDWQEHIDFELTQSTKPEFNKSLVRVTIKRDHRQIIQYVDPHESGKMDQAELVVIDEAAAIPLPILNKLIDGNYMVFMASTISGYEGTGRSLSLKLISRLREQSQKSRILHELELSESIRYGTGDEVEAWLSRFLCLDATATVTKLSCGAPPPNACKLYYVNRDTLFSFHKASEAFLMQIMAIYVSAHYKNSPNDLQVLSDAPAHNLFVLMSSIGEESDTVPQVLAVAQICLEGCIPDNVIGNTMGKTKQLPSGDLLPWTVASQFQDKQFPTMCGGRIVRIAVHPEYQNMGYGRHMIQLLENYYLGYTPSIEESKTKKPELVTVKEAALGLLEEQLVPRSELPPLLLRPEERKAEKLNYLGVAFGATFPLLRFWKRAEYVPVYLRQSQNDITGEYTCIALKQLKHSDSEELWLPRYFKEFRSRFIEFLSSAFREISTQLANVLLTAYKSIEEERIPLKRLELSYLISDSALARLATFARTLEDQSLILDLLPTIAKLYFSERLPSECQLSTAQCLILIGMGLQRKNAESLARELDMPVNQINFMCNKTILRISKIFDQICENALWSTISGKEADEGETEVFQKMKPLAQTLEEDLRTAAEDIAKRQAKDKETLLQELNNKDLKKYAITSSDEQWKETLKKGPLGRSGIVSLKSKRKPETMAIPDELKNKKMKKQKGKKS